MVTEYGIVFLLGADIDFLEIFRERGDRFHHEVDQMLRLLSRNPWLGPKRFDRQRRLLIAGSPYGLFYSVEGDRVFVSAIVDLRQDPEQIARKLRGRA